MNRSIGGLSLKTAAGGIFKEGLSGTPWGRRYYLFDCSQLSFSGRGFSFEMGPVFERGPSVFRDLRCFVNNTEHWFPSNGAKYVHSV